MRQRRTVHSDMIYGSRRVAAGVSRKGHAMNCKGIYRLLNRIGIEEVYLRSILVNPALEPSYLPLQKAHFCLDTEVHLILLDRCSLNDDHNGGRFSEISQGERDSQLLLLC